MLYRSQDKRRVFCFGAGCSLEVVSSASCGDASVCAFASVDDGGICLGEYASEESAILALDKMAIAIGTSGIMDAPTSEEIENERMFVPVSGFEWEEKPIAKKKDWRDMTIEDMDLSVRSYNCLHRTGLRTAGEIADFLAARKTIRGFGRKSCKEVQSKLEILREEDK